MNDDTQELQYLNNGGYASNANPNKYESNDPLKSFDNASELNESMATSEANSTGAAIRRT